MFKFRWVLPLLFILLAFPSPHCSGADTLLERQSLVPGQTIVSQGRKFELGFFNPVNSTDRYVGIWYAQIPVQTIVWVANREGPIRSTQLNNSRLELVGGNLTLHDGSEILWVVDAANVTEAVLLDSGNFVLRNASGVIWQSFDYPTDTWLPGGKVGYNRISGAETRLVSWKNLSDPAPGVYSLGMDPNGSTPEIFLRRNNSEVLVRSGILQDGQFSSFSPQPSARLHNFSYVSRDDTVYFVNNVVNESIIYRIQLGPEGVLRFFAWTTDSWVLYSAYPRDSCQLYSLCGENAICDIGTAPLCSCLTGFMPRLVQEWVSSDFSGGCVRRNPMIVCNGSDAEYLKVSEISLPANPESLAVGMLDVCRYACSLNCSCSAYTYRSKGGCFLYHGYLLDLQRVTNSYDGGDLFVKMGIISPMDSFGKGNKYVLPLAIALPSAAALLICSSCLCCFWKKRKRKASKLEKSHQNLLLLELSSNSRSKNVRGAARTNQEDEKIGYELPIFSFASIVAATDNFSISNKLGEGGFGPVYKAQLFNGQFVAVKRLSTRSGQGLEEFRNETELFAKLQHRNLVGILGCCIEQDEKILVYEYMPNKSLDFFLFGEKEHKQLDWGMRVQIIEGISQGLLYLHQYSRFRIIHRDLKASNILLDGDMNPKISDFGLARIFGGNKLQANTNRIVGTYGYMSPEYAMEGTFSIKSDIFAFGVLLLEVLSGKKNTGFYGSDTLSLLGHAWNLWINDRAIELVDPRLEIQSCSSSTPLKYIKIGLLCVQENPTDRPTMVEVVAMLNSTDPAAFAPPRYPAFTVGRTSSNSSSCKGKLENVSVNGLTVSNVEAR